MFNEATLTEEIVHALLFHNRYDKTDIRIRSLVEIKISNLRIINELIETRGLENIDWDGLYYSDPEEQVAKAMTEGVLMGVFPEADLNPLDSLAAEMGRKRIAEIGWDKVRKGELRTNHEHDFEVSVISYYNAFRQRRFEQADKYEKQLRDRLKKH